MTREKNLIARSSFRGFTVLEIAPVLIISAVILGGATAMVKPWLSWSNTSANQHRLEAIQLALANYQIQHNRLPCPSSFLTTDPKYKQERNIPCSVGAGTYARVGRSGAAGPPGASPMPASNPSIIIGALPVRDLGLPDSFITNSYGYAYTYAVTLSETSTTTPLNSYGGVINVVDENGNSIVPYAPADGSVGTALYAVVDHGKDGKGAYTTSGTIPIACTSIAGKDIDNCNHYAFGHFRSMSSGTRPGPNWFDDTAVYGMAPSVTSTTTPHTCTVSAPVNAGPGSSHGHDEWGHDVGSGAGGGTVISIYGYSNSFFLHTQWPLGSNSISPTAIALCPSATVHAVAGGCTQTNGAAAARNAFGTITNAYGADAVIDYSWTIQGIDNYGVWWRAHPHQIVPPQTGHPVFSGGRQGWECNGSSANGVRTQAYVVCCN